MGKKASGGNIPSARIGHSMCFYKFCLILFGGERKLNTSGKEKDCLSEVHSLNFETLTWKQLVINGP